jgi:hypothetical protein
MLTIVAGQHAKHFESDRGSIAESNGNPGAIQFDLYGIKRSITHFMVVAGETDPARRRVRPKNKKPIATLASHPAVPGAK